MIPVMQKTKIGKQYTIYAYVQSCSCVCVCVCVCMLSSVWLFAIPWTIAHQAPLSMEFSSQGH